jgi:hypothetical protein
MLSSRVREKGREAFFEGGSAKPKVEPESGRRPIAKLDFRSKAEGGETSHNGLPNEHIQIV